MSLLIGDESEIILAYKLETELEYRKGVKDYNEKQARIGVRLLTTLLVLSFIISLSSDSLSVREIPNTLFLRNYLIVTTMSIWSEYIRIKKQMYSASVRKVSIFIPEGFRILMRKPSYKYDHYTREHISDYEIKQALKLCKGRMMEEQEKVQVLKIIEGLSK